MNELQQNLCSLNKIHIKTQYYLRAKQFDTFSDRLLFHSFILTLRSVLLNVIMDLLEIVFYLEPTKYNVSTFIY